MPNNEFSPQQDAQEVWNAALSAVRSTETEQRPKLLDHSITTMPPGSQEPEQIIMKHWSDGNWSDKYRTIAITALGPVSYKCEVVSRDPLETEDDVIYSHGPDSPETLAYLRRLALRLCSE